MIYNKYIINNHKQQYEKSCTPSAVEMILKLYWKVSSDYYELQDKCNRTEDFKEHGMNFSEFDNNVEIIKKFGIKFEQKFNIIRWNNFPKVELFNTIDEELKSERYIIISLDAPNSPWNFHNYIIYEKNLDNNEYKAFTKYWKNDIIDEISNVEERINKIQGTDILIYSLV